MAEDGVRRLMMRPVGKSAGHLGQAGEPLGVVSEAIGMMRLPEGVDTEVDTQEGAHAGVEVVAEVDEVRDDEASASKMKLMDLKK